jgi:hypothetical protein
MFEHADEWSLVGRGLNCALAGEHRGLFDFDPHVEADNDKERAGQEGYAPPVVEEGLGAFADEQVDGQEGGAGQYLRLEIDRVRAWRQVAGHSI